MSNFRLTDAAFDALKEDFTATARRERFFNDPVGWVKYMLDEDLWSSQRDVANSLLNNKNTAVKAGHGVGKALSLDTPLPTPTGWTTMGDVRAGDLLLTETGEPTRVVGVSETWHEDTYRVWFDDGTFIDCASQHEWSVLDLTKRTRAMKSGVSDWRNHWDDTVTLETGYMFSHQETGSGQRRWRVPSSRAVDTPNVALPIDPYVFGAWLGDGDSNGARITTHPDDWEIIQRLRDVGYAPRKMSGLYRWSFADEGVFVSAIRDLGVYKNKHIPAQYLRSGVEQRQELLRGILDTDGSIDRRGIITIDLMSEPLARGVVELVRSLGGRATIKPRPATIGGRVVGVRWRMVIKVQGFNPFSLSRKAERWGEDRAQGSRMTQRTIVHIERIETVATRCVEVDNPRHLFLAGEGMTPTHNSHLASRLICWWVDTRAPDVFVASTAPSKAQVSQIIWDSIRSCYNKIETRYNTNKVDHKLPGIILGDDTWKINGEIVGSGRKPPDGKIEDSFQGIHRRYVLAVGDEACGLPVGLVDSLGNITTNEGSRRLLIGNPTNPASHFAKIFKEMDHTWELLTISVLDSPNFTGEPMSRAALESLTGPQYVEDKKLEYGEDSARYKARILGEFAYDIEDSLITPADIEFATSHEIEAPANARKIIGADIGGHGKDRTVLYLNDGGKISFLGSWVGEDVLVSAEKIHQIAKDNRVDVVNIDAQGLGVGAYEMLVRLCQNDPVTEHGYSVGKIISSGASPDRTKWHNLRAVMWDNLRLKIREGKISLDPLDQDLHDELVSVQAEESETSGGLLIQSKKDFRKKNSKSPDLGDACVFAAFDTEEYYSMYTEKNRTLRTTLEDWDDSVPVYDMIGDDFGLGYQYVY